MSEASCKVCRPRWLVWLLLALIVFSLAVAGLLFREYRHFVSSPVTVDGEQQLFTVTAGMSLGQLARALYQEGVIEYPRFLIQLGRQMEVTRSIKSGEYVLKPDMTPAALLSLLSDGKVVQYSLTIVDGQTFAELRTKLAQDPVLEQTLTNLGDDEVMERLGHPGEHPEGRFLADTYFFPRATSDVEFLQRAYQEMETELQKAWEQRDPDLPFESPYEALILASIVEKETALAEERPVIAGVFVRRLRAGMKLQTDPTVIYGLGDHFDGNLRRSDLLEDTPYNTYTRQGLPPTPISTPGRDAIRAVMHPAAGDSLFFVASGGGRHYFSATLDEHNLAVDKFQRGKSTIMLPQEKDRQ